MNRQIITAMLLGCLLLLAGQSLNAQYGPYQREYVRQELERTDELIVRAAEAVRVSGNPVAEQALQLARSRQENAFRAFGNGMFQMASRLTQQAREAANVALTRSRQSEQIEGVVARRLERARELLQRVQEAISPQSEEYLIRLHESARENLARAWEFYRNGGFRPALKLVSQVERTAEKLMSMAHLNGRSLAAFELRHQNAERLMREARQQLGGCQSKLGQDYMEQAEKALALASELSRNARYRAALQALKQAREAALQVRRECRGLEQIQHRYQLLKTNTEKLAEQLRQSGRAQSDIDAARPLIEAAREQLELTRRYIEEERLEPAQASLQAAQLAVRQARRYITDDL
jgi:hypothetical protein